MQLRELRTKENLSQQELSKLSGISLRTLQEYEQGRRMLMNAKSSVVYKLSVILGCSMEDLIMDSDPKETCYRYSMSGTITVSEINKLSIYSEEYDTKGRFVLRGNSCWIVMVYKGELYEMGFSVYFDKNSLPWIIDAARMRMETEIENLEFQAWDSGVMGECANGWE